MPGTESAADVDGPWVEPERESALIDRVRGYWNVPIDKLPDVALALFLRQEVALDQVLEESRRRLTAGQPDDSELYDGELADAVKEAERRATKRY